MKKKERVKSKILFNEIINNGHKISNDYFTFFYLDKDQENPLFGISAPKKVGIAVVRNKLKRITRELILKTKKMFKNNRNYIIIVKKTCLETKFSVLEEKFMELIGEANEK